MGFFGLSLVWVRIIGAVSVVIALLAAWWGFKHHYEAVGRAEVRAEWNAAIDAANVAKARREALNFDRDKQAEVARNENLQALKSDVAHNDKLVSGLHNAVSAAKQAARIDQATCIKRADTLAELFESASQEAKRLAEKADNHAVDVQRLINGWPK